MLLSFQKRSVHNDNKSRKMIVPDQNVNLDDYDPFCLWPEHISQSVKSWNKFRKNLPYKHEVCRKVKKKFLEIICTLLKQAYWQSSNV